MAKTDSYVHADLPADLSIFERGEWSTGQLTTVWALVEPKPDCRAAVRALVRLPGRTGDIVLRCADLVSDAVEFFTATRPTIEFTKGLDGTDVLIVRADGYRAGPAGDH